MEGQGTIPKPQDSRRNRGWGVLNQIWLLGLGEGGKDSDGLAGLVEPVGVSSPVVESPPPFHPSEDTSTDVVYGEEFEGPSI